MKYHKCPVCGSPLHRVHRRPINRLLSQFYRVHRYLCSNRECRWEGTLHIDKRMSWAKRLKWWVWVLAVLFGLAIAIAVLTFYKYAPPPVPPLSLLRYFPEWA